MLLTIIIPAFNEAERIGGTIEQIRRFFRAAKINYEILVIDDGSIDKTAAVVRQLAEKSPNIKLISHHCNLGKGAAVRTGVKAAKGDYILFTDADLSVPIRYFDQLWGPITEGHDISVASREKHGAKVLQSQGFPRELLGKSFGTLSKFLLAYGVADPQCGFKLFKTSIGKKAFAKVKTNSVLFDLEFLLLAHRAGAKIAEVPADWTHNPDTRIKYNLSKSLAIFRELLRIRRLYHIILPEHITTNGKTNRE